MATCCITASEATAGQEWSGLKINARGPGIWYQVHCAYLVVGYVSVNTAQVGLLLKITHWQFLKVAQRATIVSRGLSDSKSGHPLKI